MDDERHAGASETDNGSESAARSAPPVEALNQDLDWVTGESVVLDRSGAESIRADRLTMDRSGARTIEAGSVEMIRSGAVALGSDHATLSDSAAVQIVAEDVRLERSRALFVSATTATFERSRVLVFAGQANGDVRPLLDARGAAAMGGAFALVLLLAGRLLGRRGQAG